MLRLGGKHNVLDVLMDGTLQNKIGGEELQEVLASSAKRPYELPSIAHL